MRIMWKEGGTFIYIDGLLLNVDLILLLCLSTFCQASSRKVFYLEQKNQFEWSEVRRLIPIAGEENNSFSLIFIIYFLIW